MARRLDHFLRAQDYVIEQAIQEIRSGKKTGHWIWYIFPQMKGLGKSGMSETYAIQDRSRMNMILMKVRLILSSCLILLSLMKVHLMLVHS